jgi:hypothetical protein
MLRWRRPTSGGKPVRKKRRNTASTRVAAALRMAALSLRHSATALGAYYRKLARRIGGDVAVFATARKLATLIYRLLRWGQQYVDEGAGAYERRYQEIRIATLKAKAAELGYELRLNQPPRPGRSQRPDHSGNSSWPTGARDRIWERHEPAGVSGTLKRTMRCPSVDCSKCCVVRVCK